MTVIFVGSKFSFGDKYTGVVTGEVTGKQDKIWKMKWMRNDGSWEYENEWPDSLLQHNINSKQFKEIYRPTFYKQVDDVKVESPIKIEIVEK